ncbi:MAG: hypothetical protein QGI60_04930 [archaeon]|nr:hypothetical protein [archaeon]
MDKYVTILAVAAITISLLVFAVFYLTDKRPAEVLPTIPGLGWLEQVFGPPSNQLPEDPFIGDDSGNGSGSGGGSGGDGSGDGPSSSGADTDLGDDPGDGGDGGDGDDGDDGDDGGDDPGNGDDPPIDWGAGFEFPAGAVFPQEYLGDWEVYSLFGEGETRYFFLSFYPGGEFAFDKVSMLESEIGEGSQITETEFNMGSEEAQNINIPDYWWIINYANGSGTLYIYYDQTLTENYASVVSTETLSLNGIEFIKIES